MEDGCFTTLCWFLPYISVNQKWVYMSPPSWISLQLPTPSHPSRLSQSTRFELAPCIITANSHWLSVLHMVIYMFPCYSLNLSPIPSPTVSTSLLSVYKLNVLSLAGVLLGERTYRNGGGGLLLKESITEPPVVRRRWKSIDTIIIASVICYPAEKFVYKSSVGPLHHFLVLHTLL